MKKIEVLALQTVPKIKPGDNLPRRLNHGQGFSAFVKTSVG